MKSSLILLCLIGCSLALPAFESFNDDQIHVRDEKSNKFIDKVLRAAQGLIKSKNLDPAKLPDQIESVNNEVLGVNVTAEAKLYKGYFKGLSHIYRNGDCSFDQKSEKDRIIIGAKMTIKNAEAGYSARVALMSLHLDASTSTSVESIDIDFLAKINKVTKLVELTEFKVKKIGKVKVDIKGLGIIGWTLKHLANFLIRYTKDIIAMFIGGPIREALQEALDKVLSEQF